MVELIERNVFHRVDSIIDLWETWLNYFPVIFCQHAKPQVLLDNGLFGMLTERFPSRRLYGIHQELRVMFHDAV